MKVSIKKLVKELAVYENIEIPEEEELLFSKEQQEFLNLFQITETEGVNNISFERVLEIFNPKKLAELSEVLQWENPFLERFSQFQAKINVAESVKLERRRVL